MSSQEATPKNSPPHPLLLWQGEGGAPTAPPTAEILSVSPALLAAPATPRVPPSRACAPAPGAVQVRGFPAHLWQLRQSFPSGTVRSQSCLWREVCCLNFSSSSVISLPCLSTTSTSTKLCGGTPHPTHLHTRL